jgi:tRNA-Thr(GGU) m(6)t(6)A37 methyltransferase TsaA
MPAERSWPTVIPRIVVSDVAGLVAFMQAVLGATADVPDGAPAVLGLGGSVVMVSGTGPRPATPAFLYVYVDDADAAHRRALLAGAQELEAPVDTPYGDRRAMVADRWGNVWQLATRRAAACDLQPVGVVRSSLGDRAQAPMQGAEGAPDAWIEIEPAFAAALVGLEVGDDVLVITWLHLAARATLQVHPRDDATRPLTGVFATRSPDRPNPFGLHRVTVRALEGTRLRVGPLEAIDGTPVVDIKPVLDAADR